MQQDERAMLQFIYQTGPNSLIYYSMDERRKEHICLKWAKKDWYEYGVTIRSGWLTDKGKAVAATMAGMTLLRALIKHDS